MNIIILRGSLGADPVIRFSKDGKKIASFNLAVNSGYGEYKKTNWFKCVVFGKRADVVENYLKKGSKILITGELNFEEYVDKNGQKQKSHSVFVTDFEFLDAPKKQEPKVPENDFVTPPDEDDMPY